MVQDPRPLRSCGLSPWHPETLAPTPQAASPYPRPSALELGPVHRPESQERVVHSQERVFFTSPPKHHLPAAASSFSEAKREDEAERGPVGASQ